MEDHFIYYGLFFSEEKEWGDSFSIYMDKDGNMYPANLRTDDKKHFESWAADNKYSKVYEGDIVQIARIEEKDRLFTFIEAQQLVKKYQQGEAVASDINIDWSGHPAVTFNENDPERKKRIQDLKGNFAPKVTAISEKPASHRSMNTPGL